MISDLLTLTADIVAAHVEHNEVKADAVPGLVSVIYQALATADVPLAPPRLQRAQQPAVPIRRSVFPNYIVCLEDGKKLILLKRYLRENYGMTPADYCCKWNLPPDYPMVAPNYSERRSAIAKSLQLGTSKSSRS